MMEFILVFLSLSLSLSSINEMTGLGKGASWSRDVRERRFKVCVAWGSAI